MKEITSSDIMHIGFLKKECFTGSSEGMRYRMERAELEGLRPSEAAGAGEPGAGEHDPASAEAGEDGGGQAAEKRTVLMATVWPEPFCFAMTPEEYKTKESFPFTEEGVEQARQWLNQQKQKEWQSLSSVLWEDVF